MEKAIRILLVEDEVILSMTMKEQIKNIGYSIAQSVPTGEKAIAAVKANPPDLILMDIRLAGEIDGIDAAISIKSESDIPVIFITGYDDKAIRERAEKTDPLAFLIKPPKMSVLKEIIDSLFV
jgi:CheY-like chemotaxis protein